MSLHNRIITRRAFLKMIAQLPVIIAGLQTVGLTAVSLPKPLGPAAAYGNGVYSQGRYSGCCVPIGDIYLPLICTGGG